MGREHVDLILRGIDALSNGDIEGALAPFTPDVDYHDAGTGIGSTGRDAFGKWLREFMGTWAEYHETVEEAVDLGNSVLLRVRTEVLSEGSGIPMTSLHGEIHHVQGELVHRLVIYPSYAEALAAAGLTAEQAAARAEAAVVED